MSQVQRPRIAVTLGDPSGIGPEIVARALFSPRVRQALDPVLFGDERVFALACARVGVPDRLPRARSAQEATGPALVPVTALSPQDSKPGAPTAEGGRAQLAYLDCACAAIEEGAVEGLCTAPLSKAQVSKAGQRFSGHTEYLAQRFGARVLMLLAGPRLRVAVHTTHLPIAQVARAISGEGIVDDLLLLDRELRASFGIRKPRIAVCGLNPHAGDGGLFGREEAELIAPAIARARKRRVDATGPWAADGMFPRAARGEFDAVLAMYHDQGLVPLKLLHFDDGVNVTLGLPFPRTSPDHGVAYDLAGTAEARPQSMEAALLLAAKMASARTRLGLPASPKRARPNAKPPRRRLAQP